ncbi:DUF4760 domain-containing protein [Actinoplanes sp. N902-109]|uniref:DUF4760 domain-containing protein n=1 Tax=Actinoplanes sp. (strain N902-109) TaxID=649831 RepID=UPI000329570B|nr:DUF4760 domain-containing protein [Actinoplanes sp. N902-109]AGL18621.1 hypothetical protein L083_5111 [Actinoplanes sp. N902-109]
MKAPDVVAIVVNIAAVVINFCALFFVGLQVQLARRALKESAEGQERERLRLRKQATIEMAASTERYEEAMKARLPWNDRDRKQMAEFLEEAWGDTEKMTLVRAYVNHLEDLAVGVKAGVYDLETVYMLSGGRLIAAGEGFAGYVARIRSELKSPDVYEYFEDLVAKLKARQDSLSD